jgi:FkbM family methyltransferase
MNLVKFLSTKMAGISANMAFDNWPVLLFQRLFFRGNSLVVYKKGRLTFLVDFAGGDATGTRLCVSTDMYSRYFDTIGRKAVTVLDIGANGGGFPLCLHDKGIEVRKVVSVEMNPETWMRLSFNLACNLGVAATAINAAVAGREGSIQLPKTRGGTGESIYGRVANGHAEMVTIPLVTFDSIVLSRFGPGETLDLVKIDIEGAEYEVFFSETCGSIRRFEFLIIEIHDHEKWTKEDLIQRIASFGFELIPDPNPQDADVYFFKRKSAT